MPAPDVLRGAQPRIALDMASLTGRLRWPWVLRADRGGGKGRGAAEAARHRGREGGPGARAEG